MGGFRRHGSFLAIIGAAILAGGIVAVALSSSRTFSFASSIADTGIVSYATTTDLAGTSSGTLRDPAGGYAITIPLGWYAETRPSGSAALYPSFTPFPSTSSSYGATVSAAPSCKIEISSFPPVLSGRRNAWIAATVGADPTLVARTYSQDARSVDGVPAVRWRGTINGASSTLFYVFAPSHAYELVPIAPDGGDDACAMALESLFAGMTFGDRQ